MKAKASPNFDTISKLPKPLIDRERLYADIKPELDRIEQLYAELRPVLGPIVARPPPQLAMGFATIGFSLALSSGILLALSRIMRR